MSDLAGTPDPVVVLVDRLRGAGFTELSEIGEGAVNHVIECRSPGFAVRLSGDRGQWWVEGGVPGGSEWFDADLWQSCRHGTPPGDLQPGLDSQVDYFVTEHEALAERAADPATWECLRRDRARLTRERLGVPPG